MKGTEYVGSNPFFGTTCLEELVLRAESFGVPLSEALQQALYAVNFLLSDGTNPPNYIAWKSSSSEFVFFDTKGEPIPNPGTFRHLYSHMVPELAPRLSIPDGIESVFDFSFSDYRFEEVSFPESVFDVGICAFSGCTNLKSVRLGRNVRLIGGRAFWNSGVERVEFGSGMNSGKFAFIECPNLKTVEIRDGQTEIFEGMFERCPRLEEVRIPESVSCIGKYAFSGCPSLERVVAPRKLSAFFSERRGKVLSENMFGNPQVEFEFF